MRTFFVGLTIVALAVGAAALAAIGRYFRAPPTEILVPRGGELDGYVGAARCAECHREIYDRQSRSRMAGALQTAEEYDRQHRLPIPAEVNDRENGLSYRVLPRDGELILEVSRGLETARASLGYALGSGARGLTFVRDLDAGGYQELRISYYADDHVWDFTPGQENDRPTTVQQALGKFVPKRSPEACLDCHASRLVQSEGQIVPASSLFGVDCERCHGPGREHCETAARGDVAAPRAASLVQALRLAERLREGRPPASSQDAWLQSASKAADDRLIRDVYVCGECHGGRQIWSTPADDQLSRFQVAALVASKCYQESADKLRCTDCHDPHRDIEPGDQSLAVAVCLKCHSPGEGQAADGQPVSAAERARAISCPVNAVAGCVACHMPTRSPMYRTRFTHHRIGVHSESRPDLSTFHRSDEFGQTIEVSNHANQTGRGKCIGTMITN